MKTIIYFIFLFLPFLTFGQEPVLNIPYDSTTGKITFSDVVNMEGQTKETLFINARKWFAEVFVSAQSVIQMEDKEAGLLIGKGALPITDKGYSYIGPGHKGYVNFTVTISIKEGKYKYSFTDFHHVGDGMDGKNWECDLEELKSGMFYPKKTLEELREQTNISMQKIVAHMKKSIANDSNNDW